MQTRIEISFVLSALIFGCLGFFQLWVPPTPVIKTTLQVIWVVCSLLVVVVLIKTKCRTRTQSPTANIIGTGLMLLLGPLTLSILGLVGISTKIWPIKNKQPEEEERWR